MKNYFEVKKNIVLTGNSRIFNNWAEHSSITPMISSLRWNGYVMTRWMRMECSQGRIALAPDGIVKTPPHQTISYWYYLFYKFEGDNGGENGKLGTIWGGEIFD